MRLLVALLATGIFWSETAGACEHVYSDDLTPGKIQVARDAYDENGKRFEEYRRKAYDCCGFSVGRGGNAG